MLLAPLYMDNLSTKFVGVTQVLFFRLIQVPEYIPGNTFTVSTRLYGSLGLG